MLGNQTILQIFSEIFFKLHRKRVFKLFNNLDNEFIHKN